MGWENIYPTRFITHTCAAENNQTLQWSIILADSQASICFCHELNIKLLNYHGIYEIPVSVIELQINNSLQLLINNTQGNNGTLLQCINPRAAIIKYETTLIISGMDVYIDYQLNTMHDFNQL